MSPAPYLIPPDSAEKVECCACAGSGKEAFVQDNPAEMDFGYQILITCRDCGGRGWIEVPA